MNDTVLVLTATGGSSNDLLDVVRDWSAAGMVRRFAWIAQSDLTADRAIQQTPITQVDAGEVRRKSLGSYLADHQGLAVMRLVAVSWAGPDPARIDPDASARLRNDLQVGFGGRENVPIHLIMAAHGAGGWSEDLCMMGWRNLVLAPEEAWTPAADTVAEVLFATAPRLEIVEHAAAGLLSTAGLWPQVPSSPVDDENVPPHSVLAIRSFVRSLDVESVAERVHGRLLGLDTGLPRPYTATATALPYVDDAPAAATFVADQLIARHPELFPSTPEAPPQVGRTDMSIAKAIRMFFAFLVAAVKGQPGAWVQRVIVGASSGAARVTQNLIFGIDSQYRVTVNGRDGQGRLVAAGDLEQGSDAVVSELAQAMPGLDISLSLPDTSLLWREFVGGAFTLADGGPRIDGIEPARVGASAAVVPRASVIVPEPDAGFTLPGPLAARVGVTTVDPGDPFTALRVRMELEKACSDPALGATANQTLAGLRTWFRPLAHTYSGRIGDRLARGIIEAGENIEASRHMLEQASAEAAAARIQEAAGRRARFQLLLLLGLVATLLLSGIAAWRSLLTPLAAVVVVVVLLGTWFAVAFVSFFRSQTELFRLINAQSRSDKVVEIAARNYARAFADLNRILTLARQYRCWTRIVGAFLKQPFGPLDAAQDRPLHLRGVRPRCVGLGEALIDEDRIGLATERLSARLFQQGWLGDVWRDFLASAPAALGAAGVAIEGRAESLYGDRARVSDSLLEMWAETVKETGVDSAVGRRFWQSARTTLLGDATTPVTVSVLDRVEVFGGSDNPAMTATAFLDGLAQGLAEQGERPFHLDLFTPMARNTLAQNVSRSVLYSTDGQRPPTGMEHRTAQDGRGLGLNQFALLIQLSAPVAAADLTLSGTPSTAPGRDGAGHAAPVDPSAPPDGAWIRL